MAHHIDAKTGQRFWLLGKAGEELRSNFDPMLERQAIRAIIIWSAVGVALVLIAIVLDQTVQNVQMARSMIYLVACLPFVFSAYLVVELVERKRRRNDVRSGTSGVAVSEQSWAYKALAGFQPVRELMLGITFPSFQYIGKSVPLLHLRTALRFEKYFEDTYNASMDIDAVATVDEDGDFHDLEIRHQSRLHVIYKLRELILDPNGHEPLTLYGFQVEDTENYLKSLHERACRATRQEAQFVRECAQVQLEDIDAFERKLSQNVPTAE